MTPNELRHRVAAIREEFRRMKFDAYQRAALMQVFELLDQQDALVRAADEMAAAYNHRLNRIPRGDHMDVDWRTLKAYSKLREGGGT